VFLTAIGDAGGWAEAYGYLPYPWSAAVWFVWLPAAACFALAPAFLIGLACGVFTAFAPGQALFTSTLLAIVWITAYGCALHAAAFFMPRGMRLLGGIFVVSGIILLGGYAYCPWLLKPESAHYLMGIFFGVLHLAYGTYLYFTEKQKQAA
jgi:hypothetical protein